MRFSVLVPMVAVLLFVCGRSIAAGVSTTEKIVTPTPSMAEISPDLASIEACKPLLEMVPQEKKRIAQIREILNNNLHWRGDRHTFFPSRNADWNEMQAARSQMQTSDIPILVHLVGTGQLRSSLNGIALGVLIQFGMQALPCIQAGISIYQTQHTSDLLAITTDIKVNASQQ